jgi:hypothetical protein
MAIHNDVADDEKNSKLLPLPTFTMVLKVFWADIWWGDNNHKHLPSRFPGPGG